MASMEYSIFDHKFNYKPKSNLCGLQVQVSTTLSLNSQQLIYWVFNVTFSYLQNQTTTINISKIFNHKSTTQSCKQIIYFHMNRAPGASGAGGGGQTRAEGEDDESGAVRKMSSREGGVPDAEELAAVGEREIEGGEYQEGWRVSWKNFICKNIYY